MKTSNKTIVTLLLCSTLALLFSFTIPEGWSIAGSKPKSYEMGIDKGAGQDGTNAATIKSVDKNIKGFGCLMQNCSPEKYLGHRVRMTALVKTKDVEEWSGIWFRIDQHGSSETLGFDNMHDGKKERSIKGTTAWAKYEIILDVPQKASQLAYGALLVGTGQIWFDQIHFEIVENTVETTGADSDHPRKLAEPINLDFDK